MPIVALLTDFGIRDHYAGTMKAVVLGVCPDATLVDITHDIAPQDVAAAALELAACYRYFPAGTVFLVVVDPGVGSGRRGLAADAGGYQFVAPDNGVLTAVFRDTPPARVVELAERQFARATVSRTFEGRDRFAPAAGWLASGVGLESFGPVVTDYMRLALPAAAETDSAITGEIVRIDHFGNAITNIERSAFDRFSMNGPVFVKIHGREIARVVSTYAEVAHGEACALFGSTDHLEIAINGGNAAEALGIGRGAPIVVTRPNRTSEPEPLNP
jgi:S-adenosylmethionine hydrolase